MYAMHGTSIGLKSMTLLKDISSAAPLLLLGCGKMGGAMLNGWLENGLDPAAVIIADPYLKGAREIAARVPENAFFEKLSDLPAETAPSFAILAVKPQMMDEALTAFKGMKTEKTLFLSVAAGKTIGYFTSHLGTEAAIVRAMPNTPASIGMGMTVACPNANVSAAQKEICFELLSAVGLCDFVDEEELMDAVTAVSGSGPAYIFHMVEAMAQAGEKLGLSKELSAKLAAQTVSGAGALLYAADEDATQLRINVTSPKGTTEAALNVLMAENGLGKLMEKALKAACDRSKELAG
jgi:pyrroline-5-carboxylate reductase